jgi:putative phage-type endonuclease
MDTWTLNELLPAHLAGPHNPTWHALRTRTDAGWSVTASEIAAILGISPWHSPFSLYWAKRMGWRTDDNPYMKWGRLFEGIIGEEFIDAYPDLDVRPIGLVANRERPWQLATPDLLAYNITGESFTIGGESMRRVAIFPVQIKTERTLEPTEWGPEGSDLIPVHYRAQVLWEIDVLGVDIGVLYVLPLDTREPRAYIVNRDERDLRLMRTRAERFRVLLDGDVPPPLDAHKVTLTTVKRLHPALGDYPVEIPESLADGYRRANALARRAQKLCDLYEARVREAMGDGRFATRNGKRIASRSMYMHYKGQTIVDKLTETKKGRTA